MSASSTEKKTFNVYEYPRLAMALPFMLQDQGVIVDMRECEQDEESDPSAADAALRALSFEEIATLSAGDQENWGPVLEKLGDQADNVHRTLDSMFMHIGNLNEEEDE